MPLACASRSSGATGVGSVVSDTRGTRAGSDIQRASGVSVATESSASDGILSPTTRVPAPEPPRRSRSCDPGAIGMRCGLLPSSDGVRQRCHGVRSGGRISVGESRRARHREGKSVTTSRNLLTWEPEGDYSCRSVRRRSLALLLLGLGALATPATVRAGVLWKGAPPGCEPLSTFYSPTHQPGTPPCCPTQPTVCPGGIACPANGRCGGTGTACVASQAPTRPNVILTISDDQGSCHYGTAGECRSVQTGTPIPPPATPNLDLLAGYGTVFPIAHNTASWCFPSLNSMLTGRYQKSFGGMRRDLSGNFRTIPAVLRDLEGLPGTVRDPFDADNNVIGGYCTLLAGKFTGAAGKTEFNGEARTGERALGRELCSSGPPGQPP